MCDATTQEWIDQYNEAQARACKAEALLEKSSYKQRKKIRTRLRELEEMRREIRAAAFRIENELCTCTVSYSCKTVHTAAEMIYAVLRKYKETK